MPLYRVMPTGFPCDKRYLYPILSRGGNVNKEMLKQGRPFLSPIAGSISYQFFPDFPHLSESCLKNCQTALKLTPKGLDYKQIGTLPEPRITIL